MGGIPERLWAAWVQTFLLCSSLFLPFLESVQCESSKSLWQDLQLWAFGLWPSSAPPCESNKMGLFREVENGQGWGSPPDLLCSWSLQPWRN